MIRLMYPDGRTEKLRWTDQHALSSYGIGVVLHAHSGEALDGARFAPLAATGAWIECSSDIEARRVAGALAWRALELVPDAIRIIG